MSKPGHGPGHTHNHDHSHEHEHTRGHDHDHTHTREQKHDHTRSHDHSQEHDRSHDHSHDHTHTRGHKHDHAHGRSLMAHIRHRPSSAIGWHSHDPADSIDDALESSSEATKALVISFSVLMVTALGQLFVVYFTNSVALLADTIHNVSDASTAIPLFIAFRMGRRPPNRTYTYGYRRAEDLAGGFVVLVITASAVIAAYESIERLINPRPLEAVGVLFAAGMIGFVGNEWVAVYRIRTGRRIGSAALVADGLHARVDGLTSLAVVVAAVLAWTGFERADPIVGIGVSIAIFGVLRTAARDIYRRIMDAVDPALVGQVEDLTLAVPGVNEITVCQIRWMGHRLRADIGIAVDGWISVTQANQISEEVADALRREVTHLDTVFVHIGEGSAQANR